MEVLSMLMLATLIISRFPKSIHAVTIDGFLLKLATFIVAFTLEAAFID